MSAIFDRFESLRALNGACSLFVLGALAVMPVSAHAQVEMRVSDEAAGAAGGEIIVTARRRAESSQNVPIAITAFDTAALERNGVTMIADIQHFVPGLHYRTNGNLQTEITIRGVGGDARNPGVETGVGIYVDGVYVPRTSGFNSDLSDVAQVEVLRGPQGTLFGKNVIGGVINITTRKPTADTEGFLYTSYGNYQAFRTQASISGKVAESLFAKLSFATWDRQGYIYNVQRNEHLNNEDRRGVRAQLRYNPSSQLDVNLVADVTRDRRLGVFNQIGSSAGAAAPYFTGNPRRMDADQRNVENRDMWGVSLTADYTVADGSTITSITAHRSIDILNYGDIDQTPLDLFHSGPNNNKTNMFSQELRLVSPSSSRLRYVAGLFYYNQDVSNFNPIFQMGVRTILLDASAKTRSYAGYGNLDFDLTSQIMFSGGLRYNYDRKTGFFGQTRTNLNYALNLDRTDKNLSWMASVVFKATPAVSAYATVSRGFKSGGFNLDTAGAVGLTAASLNFNPENVTNYETGLKGRFFGNVLRTTLAIFHLDYKDKQVSQFIQPPIGNIPIVLVTNAGQARINGVEADATLQIVKGLRLQGNVSYLDAKYKQFDDAALVKGVLVSYTGNRLERTPRWTWEAMAEYRLPVGPGEIVASGSLSHTGNVYFQPDNATVNYGPGYTLVDGRFGFETEGGKLGVFLWGKNLTNKTYLTFSRQFAGLQQVLFGEPRTYGVELRYKF